jgi:hypothetical protein
VGVPRKYSGLRGRGEENEENCRIKNFRIGSYCQMMTVLSNQG